MADPYVLGVSSGASLGAVLGIVFGLGRALGLWALPALAFIGAFLSTAVVYALSLIHIFLESVSSHCASSFRLMIA